ncbi:MAG TPA: hypothetical protein VN461_19205 [Vicinamibacteria bacterium]|nr:hypothetical protein [Vicinamibacteria bacterium]
MPADLLAAAAPTPAPAVPAPERLLLVLDLSRVTAETLAPALGLLPAEAARRVRRGGYQLHRIAFREAASTETDRLRGAGLFVIEVPEAEAHVRPLLAKGGTQDADGLSLRAEGGALRVSPGQVLLVVRGPIAREYQALPTHRRVSAARPEEGHRIHLHLRGEPRPLELDPANFEFGRAPTAGSSLLELNAWVEAIAPEAPRDEAFRQEPPALSLAAPAEREVAARALNPPREKEPPPILENLEQFRFYSAWRAAVERRR